jgi:hypothetical protein
MLVVASMSDGVVGAQDDAHEQMRGGHGKSISLCKGWDGLEPYRTSIHIMQLFTRVHR